MINSIVGCAIFIGLELIGFYALVQYIRLLPAKKLKKTSKTDVVASEDLTSMSELIALEKQQMSYFGIATAFVFTNLAIAYVFVFC